MAVSKCVANNTERRRLDADRVATCGSQANFIFWTQHKREILMTEKSRARALVISLLLAALGTGCGPKVLDFRNADIANNKIYSDGANQPFSGKVTNIPMGKLPLGQLGPLVTVLTTATGDQSYSGFFMANAIAAIVGGGGGPTMCDVHTSDGLLDGDVQCSIKESRILEVEFKKGAMEGEARILDPRGKGIAAKAQMEGGKLNGGSTVYDSETGKILHTVGWVNGQPSGSEKQWNKAGTLVWEASIVAGKYEGKAVRYNEHGELVATTLFRGGVAERNSLPAAANPQAAAQGSAACLDSWIAAFRKEHGEEAAVNHGQLEEWEAWCKEGKRPA